MKKTSFSAFALLAALILVSSLVSCGNGQSAAPVAGAPEAVSRTDASYAFGSAIGRSIKSISIDLDYNEFVKGMKDSVAGKSKTDAEKENTVIQKAIAYATWQNGEKEKTFLADNAKKANVKTTASGLQYEVIKEGTGEKPAPTDMVKVDYVGTLTDGYEFDSSVKRGEPAEFPLDQVIPGWSEGLQLMTVGSKYKLYVPSALGYGPEPRNGIPGNATLVFEVELLSFAPAPVQPEMPEFDPSMLEGLQPTTTP